MLKKRAFWKERQFSKTLTWHPQASQSFQNMLIASTTSKIVSFEDMAEEINELRQETRLFSRNHREVSE